MQLKNRLKSDRITVYCRCDEIGNHASLKMMWAQALVGSSPTSGTNIKLSMIIADGKAIAQKVLSQIKTGLDGSRSGASPTPGELCRSVSIAAVWAGNDPATARFVELKKKRAESIGIKIIIFHFDSSDPEEKIINKIVELSEDKYISGIIVELPLPERFDRDKILNLIPKEKDVDVLSSSAQEDFYSNKSKILPPAVGALKILFEEYKVNPKDKVTVVFGQSILIGKPISHWLENVGAKVSKIDENTQNPKELCLKADLIISGVGKPNLISGNMVKNGAVVVDFGFEKLGDRVIGDVDFDSVAPKSSLITPVPGGMGPIVVVAFLKNTVQVAQNSLSKLDSFQEKVVLSSHICFPDSREERGKYTREALARLTRKT